MIWRLSVEPSPIIGLATKSRADVIQVPCASLERTRERTGVPEADLLAEVTAARALIVMFE